MNESSLFTYLHIPCNSFGRFLVVVSFRCYPLEPPGKFQPSGVLVLMFLSFSFVLRLVSFSFMPLYLFLGFEVITDADGIKLLSTDTLISVNRTASETKQYSHKVCRFEMFNKKPFEIPKWKCAHS